MDWIDMDTMDLVDSYGIDSFQVLLQALMIGLGVLSHVQTERFWENTRKMFDHGSQIGAVYMLNERKTDIENFESIGLSADRRASFWAGPREGDFGTALATFVQAVIQASPEWQAQPEARTCSPTDIF